MDTIITTVFGGILVTVLAYAFSHFKLNSNVQRLVVFVLSVIGGAAQLLLSHKLSLGSDPALWFTAIMSIQGAAQILYGLVAAGLNWNKDATATTNPT